MRYFLLVLALSLPFWLAGALTDSLLPAGLPVSALMFICPTAAALIFVYRENRIPGMIELLKRAFDYKRIKAVIWYLPILLLMPGIMALSFVLMRLTNVPVPAPEIAALESVGMFLLFFFGALGEEPGWSGYVTDPMQERWGALGAGVLLGTVWAIWHIVPYLEAERSWPWIAWYCLFTVAIRVVIVWLYNNTGRSVFATAVFHTMVNVTWNMFPIDGSFFDPRITGLVTMFVAVLVVIVWGPRTLTRFEPG